MSDKVGTVMMGTKEELVFLGRDLGEQRNYSEEVAALIDEEIRAVVQEAFVAAKRILTERRAEMDRVVARLREVETIEASELEALASQPLPVHTEAAGAHPA
jgi:cell division protease FtsH